MRLIIIILFSVMVLFSKDISEKLIVSGDTNSTTTQMHLFKLKMYFMENAKIRAMQEQYKLNLEMETLGDYTMVVIRPIKSLAVKNELLMLLGPLFPDTFSIENKKKEMQTPPSDTNMMHQAKVLVDEIGLPWVALLLLSIIGLTISVNSRSRMASLESIQKELGRKQEQIENEIKHLGTYSV